MWRRRVGVCICVAFVCVLIVPGIALARWESTGSSLPPDVRAATNQLCAALAGLLPAYTSMHARQSILRAISWVCNVDDMDSLRVCWLRAGAGGSNTLRCVWRDRLELSLCLAAALGATCECDTVFACVLCCGQTLRSISSQPLLKPGRYLPAVIQAWLRRCRLVHTTLPFFMGLLLHWIERPSLVATTELMVTLKAVATGCVSTRAPTHGQHWLECRTQRVETNHT